MDTLHYAYGHQKRMMDFARLHDWGYDAVANPDGSITVGCDVVNLDGSVREFTTVRTMDQLRAVAGY